MPIWLAETQSARGLALAHPVDRPRPNAPPPARLPEPSLTQEDPISSGALWARRVTTRIVRWAPIRRSPCFTAREAAYGFKRTSPRSPIRPSTRSEELVRACLDIGPVPTARSPRRAPTTPGGAHRSTDEDLAKIRAINELLARVPHRHLAPPGVEEGAEAWNAVDRLCRGRQRPGRHETFT